MNISIKSVLIRGGHLIEQAVESKDFYQYVPGVRHNSVRYEKWDSIAIDQFSYDSVVENVEAPPVKQHIFAINGDLYDSQPKEVYRGLCRINGQIRYQGAVHQGNCFVIPRYSSICWNWRSTDGKNVAGTGAYLTEDLLRDIALKTLEIDPSRIELALRFDVRDEFLVSVIRQLCKDINQRSSINRIYAETLSQAFGLYVLRHYSTQRAEKKDRCYRGGLRNDVLKRVIDYMHEYLMEPLGLKELSNIAGLSPYYFIRLFKQSTSKSPHQYLIELRMEHAKKLLSSTQISILDIAYTCGYGNPASFTHAFKQMQGITPSKYRQIKTGR